MPDTMNHPAVAVLQSFFAEMREWEVNALRAYKAIDWATTTHEKVDGTFLTAQQGVEKIFETYCDVGTRAKRLKGKPFLSDPTSYDPEKEPVTSVEVKRGKVIIETQQMFGLKFEKRYELVERNGQWKIRDNSKYSVLPSEKPEWEAAIL